jgi:hypothetical protein
VKSSTLAAGNCTANGWFIVVLPLRLGAACAAAGSFVRA